MRDKAECTSGHVSALSSESPGRESLAIPPKTLCESCKAGIPLFVSVDARPVRGPGEGKGTCHHRGTSSRGWLRGRLLRRIVEALHAGKIIIALVKGALARRVQVDVRHKTLLSLQSSLFGSLEITRICKQNSNQLRRQQIQAQRKPMPGSLSTPIL